MIDCWGDRFRSVVESLLKLVGISARSLELKSIKLVEVHLLSSEVSKKIEYSLVLHHLGKVQAGYCSMPGQVRS